MESKHYSGVTSSSQGKTYEQGGRSLVSPSPPSPAAQVRRLVQGDTLSLVATTMQGDVYAVIFCVALLHPE